MKTLDSVVSEKTASAFVQTDIRASLRRFDGANGGQVAYWNGTVVKDAYVNCCGGKNSFEARRKGVELPATVACNTCKTEYRVDKVNNKTIRIYEA